MIGNPNAGPAQVKITLLPENAPKIEVPIFTVAASSRFTFTVRPALPAGGASVSAIVESLPPSQGASPLPLVVERTMTWAFGQRRGGHNSPGVLATAPTWYLAEGTTGFFKTYILITNPDPNQDANVEVKYLRELGDPITQTLTVVKNGRVTIDVDGGLDLDHNGTLETQVASPFSTVVRSTNNVNIAVERAMYWNDFEGGHESTGITTPHKTWLFAEGNTGGDASFSWDTFLLLGNPHAAEVSVTLTFFRQSGAPVVYNTELPANSRTTVNVRDIDANNDTVKDLSSASFSTKIEAELEIIAERAMYWSSNGIFYIEGHNTPGVNAEALKWAFADGVEGSIDATGLRFSSFLLVSNSSTSPLDIKATFVREDGKGLVKTFSIAPQSRFTIPTGTFPELSHQRFSAFIESTNNIPFVSERAVYWGPGFYGGHASVGTPWDAAIAEPPVLLLSPVVNNVSPVSGLTTGGTEVTITGSNFIEHLTGANTGTRVKFGSLDATSVTIISDTKLIATTPPVASPGPVSITVSNKHLNSAWQDVTLANAFTYNPVEPTLQTDHTLAFGDSITLGTTTTTCDVGGGTQVYCEAPNDPGYPSRLRNLLRARYPKQGDIDVVNAGIPRECVARHECTGKSGGQRLLDRLESGDTNDLVVILEGVNDLNQQNIPLSEIIEMLRRMIGWAKSQGKKVILSTLTPVKAPLDNVNQDVGLWKANPHRIAELNARIDALSVEQNVPRVNMFAAFGSGSGALDCNYTPSCRALLSPDGLHPNAAGYARMADVINAKIVETFEVR